MKRGTVSWMLLGVCAALIAGAMGWFTGKVRELERARLGAEARADLGERTRLALWRMDAAGAAIVSAENGQAPAHYRMTDGPAEAAQGLAVSPFVGADDPLVRLHFEVSRGGSLRTPETDERQAALAGVDAAWLAERRARLERLRGLLAAQPLAGGEWAALCRAAQVGETAWLAMPKDAFGQTVPEDLLAQQAQPPSQVRQQAVYQQEFSNKERAQRARVVEETVNKVAANNLNAQQQALPQQVGGARDAAANAPARAVAEAPAAEVAARLGGRPEPSQVPAAPRLDSPGLPRGEDQAADAGLPGPVSQAAPPAPLAVVAGETIVELGTMRPVWIGDELFLLRRVVVQDGFAGGGSELRIQGVWLDAAALRQKLLDGVADLLPAAALAAVTEVAGIAGAPPEDALALVSFPFRLEPGAAAGVVLAPDSPLERSLRVGWAAVGVAMLAAGLLVAAVMRLSERRASFVSSVTHELRTPLTTFRLYSDMLAEGMVKDERKRRDYLRTMRSEADRLHHLVENVLAYSRIERGSARARREQVDAAAVLERMRGRLEERAQRDGLELELDWECEGEPVVVETDVTAVEQIVFNLVDNACKYGRREGGGGKVKVRGGGRGQRWWIEVRDEGPGVAAAEARRMFRPFHKSASEAAHSMPGVGLGLALSRRLARALGGELSLRNAGERGAVFRVDL